MMPKQPAKLRHLVMSDAHAFMLAPRVAGCDRLECELFGHTVESALLMGLNTGPALTAVNDDREAGDKVAGCFGVTDARVIWSLWRFDLTLAEQLSIMRLLPTYVRMLNAERPGVLYNWVMEENVRARRWLEASGLFEFGQRYNQEGRVMLQFQTKGSSANV